MKKLHFEYFIADYFPVLNKKDPVLLFFTVYGRREDLRGNSANVILFSVHFFGKLPTKLPTLIINWYLHISQLSDTGIMQLDIPVLLMTKGILQEVCM